MNRTQDDFETYDNFDPKSDKYEANSTFDIMNENSLFLDQSKRIPNSADKKVSCRKKVRRILRSHHFHIAVIVLVVIDCFCIGIELIIDSMEKHLEQSDNSHLKHFNNHHSNNSDLSFTKKSQNTMQNNYIFHFILKLAENIIKYISLAIVAFFVIELIFKIIFMPKIFIKNKFEIFDAIVVVISFIISVLLIYYKSLIYTMGALVTLLR